MFGKEIKSLASDFQENYQDKYKRMASMEEIAYAPGQSLSVMVKPRDTEWMSFCSSLCAQQTDAFHLVDLGELLHSHQLWMKNMPQIRPYYAVKANDDPAIIMILASLGCGFDCASRGELEKVLCLAVNPNNIIFANPQKQPDHIQFAASQGVHWYTFDSKYELQKMSELDPSAELLVRLKVDNPQSDFQPGDKFGVTVLEACSLVKSAKDCGLPVNGVCFHIGDCVDPSIYVRALEMTCEVFDYARDELDLTLSVVDIGGGFVVSEQQEEAEVAYKQTATVVNKSAETVFAAYPDVKVIAEPGRFFAKFTTCSFAQVIGKRQVAVEDRQDFWYCLNDGAHGSLWAFPKQPLMLKEGTGALCRSKLYGPTCSPFDFITDAVLPELNGGDWLYFKGRGAYAAVITSTFNGFPKPRSFLMVAEDMLDDLKLKLNN